MYQVILGLLSDAGGVGKTTLAVNIAYEWSCRGLSVAILDLDANHSLEDFVGMTGKPKEQTIAKVFEDDFDGNWPLQTPYDEEKLQVCPGHPSMVEAIEKLLVRVRREYYLTKLLKQYPLPHDLIILDCNSAATGRTEKATTGTRPT